MLGHLLDEYMMTSQGSLPECHATADFGFTAVQRKLFSTLTASFNVQRH